MEPFDLPEPKLFFNVQAIAKSKHITHVSLKPRLLSK